MKESTGCPVTAANSNKTQAHQVLRVRERTKLSKRSWKRGVKISTSKQIKPNTHCGFPPKLVGPSPIIPIQVEGIYAKALLDTGAQVTLLYKDFNEKHLKHLPLQKLEELEIWGLGTQNFPYEGFIPIKLTFDPSVAGKAETFDTLAVVCPRPPGAHGSSLIIGTNTDLVRRLLTPLVQKESAQAMKVHPMLTQVYKNIVHEQKAPLEGVGKIWLLDRGEELLQSGEVICLKASVKLSWRQPSPFIVLETDTQEEDIGLEVIPKVLSTKAFKRSRGRVLVSVQNTTGLPVKIPARMLLGQANQATPVSPCDVKRGPEGEIPLEDFYPKNTSLTPAWMERAKAQLIR